MTIKYFYKKDKKEKIEKLNQVKKNFWIHVINPSDEEINLLVKKFNLSKDNLIDGLDIHENSRFEIANGIVYIYLTAPTENVKGENDSSFLIIYSQEFFITFSKNNLEIFDKVFESDLDLNVFDSSRNLVKILFLLSRMYEKSIHKIRKDVKKNKRDLSTLKNKDVEMLIHYEDKLNEYISSFGMTINTYMKILRAKSVYLIKKDEEIVEDLIIDLNETLDLCKNTLKTISNMRDYYSTKLSNNLNNIVKILTLATVFISIPTLITSLYGMNVPLPFQNSPHIFSFIILFIFIFLVILFFFMKKLKLT